ncbi:uncharacterized protein STEHIDRAFT_125859 [Stereum hirsutum FP-91666 SS1]|uniref:uncharacterized protein n=1 Tax=Stereum hirsutum (strain FP-91666) TaxID=721885 RepID=UPI000440AABB|nr:uncharacterized protein STEHIDRAFT_121384 [Stereum hirsutum FP-91666 SS1]XP_007310369.1 uncharacterized protein STEHIDRAFT_125859 [Stereum hirsutum FP-91666 SS1]EIM80925.1 hypothetical protein STEHIDRAFT_125859 [Stereum hirsutum FP-91666 SS1]EIM86438.1 hypothetical protein STEHIDRAFT_121384 [Stereum hirsutum FP-91666 SS1]
MKQTNLRNIRKLRGNERSVPSALPEDHSYPSSPISNSEEDEDDETMRKSVKGTAMGARCGGVVNGMRCRHVVDERAIQTCRRRAKRRCCHGRSPVMQLRTESSTLAYSPNPIQFSTGPILPEILTYRSKVSRGR